MEESLTLKDRVKKALHQLNEIKDFVQALHDEAEKTRTALIGEREEIENIRRMLKRNAEIENKTHASVVREHVIIKIQSDRLLATADKILDNIITFDGNVELTEFDHESGEMGVLAAYTRYTDFGKDRWRQLLQGLDLMEHERIIELRRKESEVIDFKPID